jgi:hypothetical protein
MFLSLGFFSAEAAPSDYRFDLVGKPTVKAGISTVSVRLVHIPDHKPVSGAVVIQTRADMGPEQMASMTAPVKAVSAAEPGVYAFQIQNGAIWNKPGKWALTLAAKVQGETETVRGTVTLELVP